MWSAAEFTVFLVTKEAQLLVKTELMSPLLWTDCNFACKYFYYTVMTMMIMIISMNQLVDYYKSRAFWLAELLTVYWW